MRITGLALLLSGMLSLAFFSPRMLPLQSDERTKQMMDGMLDAYARGLSLSVRDGTIVLEKDEPRKKAFLEVYWAQFERIRKEGQKNTVVAFGLVATNLLIGSVLILKHRKEK